MLATTIPDIKLSEHICRSEAQPTRAQLLEDQARLRAAAAGLEEQLRAVREEQTQLRFFLFTGVNTAPAVCALQIEQHHINNTLHYVVYILFPENVDAV